jgi:hypothetical protein
VVATRQSEGGHNPIKITREIAYRLRDDRMKKIWVLFLCVENSVRSQMLGAAARFDDELFEAYSAGLETGLIHPYT